MCVSVEKGGLCYWMIKIDASYFLFESCHLQWDGHLSLSLHVCAYSWVHMDALAHVCTWAQNIHLYPCWFSMLHIRFSRASGPSSAYDSRDSVCPSSYWLVHSWYPLNTHVGHMMTEQSLRSARIHGAALLVSLLPVRSETGTHSWGLSGRVSDGDRTLSHIPREMVH